MSVWLECFEMSITLGLNIASLRSQRQLGKTSAGLGTVFERLSSGLRINSASDDPAGLAVADSLKANQLIYNQAVRNLVDGQSLLSVADTALSELTGIVMRLEELATQASSSTYTTTQREALNVEAHALSDEFLRITRTTEFNGQKLFTGENPIVSLQAGAGENAILQTSVGGAVGTGEFTGVFNRTASQGYVTSSVNLGDINGDGVLDLVTAGNGFGSGYATVRTGTGAGAFGEARYFATEQYTSSDSQLADINGDGILDLITAGRATINGHGYATARLGDGSGSFNNAISYATGDIAYDLEVVDLNGDDKLDLITSGAGSQVIVRLGDGSGSFGTAQTFTGISTFNIALGDVNGDELLDLVGDQGGEVRVHLGDGAGSFNFGSTFASLSGNARDSELVDLNQDGTLDLVLMENSVASVFLGNGVGSFTFLQTLSVGPIAGRQLDVADVNGDGLLDILYSGPNASLDGYVGVLLGDGNGSFDTFTSFATGSDGFAITTGDVDGDGILDVVTNGYSYDDYFGYASVHKGISTSGVAPLLPFSLATSADARQALPILQRKHEQLVSQRGEIGALQARIEIAASVLTIVSENLSVAESRIRDADSAHEAAELIRLQLLQQATAAVLAQANQQPALVLSLLS